MLKKFDQDCPTEFWERTPSRKDGITELKELEMRQKVCRFMLTMLRAMKIEDHFAEIHAFMLIQIFYNRFSFANSSIDKYDLGLAAVFLSLKLNDRTKTLTELILNQWKYLSPNVPLPTGTTKAFKERLKCILFTEMKLISTINFRLEYPNHLIYGNKIVDHFFPALFKENPKIYKNLVKLYYFLSYHSFWTHLGLFHGPFDVAFACLKQAVLELKQQHKIVLKFSRRILDENGIDSEKIIKIQKILREKGQVMTS
ncbi:hypothetical protein MHBO_002457 [Bonamia ostreae]|uniref:Cyclin N-terminal domain-containing protein n=1 Tax=Bonamia ostreae TaxID=126728 RepID=A0ABV2ANC7_9EUKA